MSAVHLLDRDTGSVHRPEGSARAVRLRRRWWVGLGVGAAATMLGFVDPAQRRVAPPCLVHAFTGLECPGCGSTRAVHELLNGNPLAALDLNPLVILAAPMMAWYLVAWLAGRTASFASDGSRRRWLAALVVVVVAYGVVRNVGVAPFTYLAASP